jgi:hypothetical protein
MVTRPRSTPTTRATWSALDAFPGGHGQVLGAAGQEVVILLPFVLEGFDVDARHAPILPDVRVQGEVRALRPHPTTLASSLRPQDDRGDPGGRTAAHEQHEMFDHATAAVEGALAAGASYADARVVIRRHEALQRQNGELEQATHDEDAGVGVRA